MGANEIKYPSSPIRKIMWILFHFSLYSIKFIYKKKSSESIKFILKKSYENQLEIISDFAVIRRRNQSP